MFLREFVVRQHERALLFRNGDFVRFLAPAVYRFFDPQQRLTVERFDLSHPLFEHPLLDYLVRWQAEAVEDLFLRVETRSDQVAVVTASGRLCRVVGPGERALFWKGVVRPKAEYVDIGTELAIEPALARTLANAARHRCDGAVLIANVPEAHVGLLFVDGALLGELAPGAHAFWNFGRRVQIEIVDARWQELVVTARALPTQDQAEVSIDVQVLYRFDAPSLTARTVKEPLALLRETIRLALRPAAAARSLEELFEDRLGVDAGLLEPCRERLAPFGLDVRALCIEQITIDRDPLALRLRELEAVERRAIGGQISVFAGLDGALGELVRIKL